jgi:hypothetical protein
VARKRNQRVGILALALASALWAPGCALLGKPEPPVQEASGEPDASVYRRADADRLMLLEHEIERLRADLRVAEETLVAVESGIRGAQTRAEAVSMLAEARIEVGRAAKRAPWRADSVTEAEAKLEEADRQLAANHIGSAIFFVSRASRIAATLVGEADLVSKAPVTRYVKGSRVNLRSGPNTESPVLAVLPPELPVFPESDAGEWVLVRTVSGKVGWVHATLLQAP